MTFWLLKMGEKSYDERSNKEDKEDKEDLILEISYVKEKTARFTIDEY